VVKLCSVFWLDKCIWKNGVLLSPRSNLRKAFDFISFASSVFQNPTNEWHLLKLKGVCYQIAENSNREPKQQYSHSLEMAQSKAFIKGRPDPGVTKVCIHIYIVLNPSCNLENFRYTILYMHWHFLGKSWKTTKCKRLANW